MLKGQPKPLVSVIMNCLNCEAYLREALDSVYAQTYPNWEIIFWDNASIDRSADIVGSYDGRVRYFRGDCTLPLGAARNIALEQARGEYLALLDCDDLWQPNKLEKQIPLFQDPEVGLVFSDALSFNEKGETQLFYSKKRYHTGNCFSQLLSGNFLIISTVVIRRGALDKQGPWFEPEFTQVEEYDFFIRIAHRWKLAIVNEPLTKWRIHSLSWTWSMSHPSDREKSFMLSKYHDLFPNFAVTYAKEIKIFRINMAVARARILILKKCGSCREARTLLLPHIFRSKKAFVLFVLTFFPDKISYFIVSKIGGAILPS